MSGSAPGHPPPYSHEADESGSGAPNHLAKLARRGTASVLGAGFSALSGVLLVVIVTNGFTATTAGTLFSATSAFLILESIALIGTDTGLVRCLPDQLAAGRVADLRRTLAISALPVLVLSVGMSVVLYLSSAVIAPHLVGTEAAATMVPMLRVLAVVLPVAALHDVVVTATRGLGSMRPTVLVENTGRLGLQALGVLGVYLLGGGPTALALAWGLPYLAGLAVAAVWMRAMLARTSALPARSEGAAPPRAPTAWRPLAGEFWSYTGPRAIARVTQTALKKSDIVLVAALASPADAALYAAATRFIVLGQLFVQAVQQALSPHLSSLFARGDRSAADSLFKAATLWSVLASWPFYLVLAGFSPALMGVFGHGYDVASDVVLVLSLTMLLATACGPVDAVLLMAGRSWLSLRNSSIALAVNVGLNLVLIPTAGIRGAAISWAVAIVVRNLLPLVQVRRDLGMWPVTRPTVRLAAAALACFGAADLAGAVAPSPHDGVVGGAVLAVAALVYLTALRSWRGSLGLDAFRTALRPRRKVKAPVPEFRDEAAPGTT